MAESHFRGLGADSFRALSPDFLGVGFLAVGFDLEAELGFFAMVSVGFAQTKTACLRQTSGRSHALKSCPKSHPTVLGDPPCPR